MRYFRVRKWDKFQHYAKRSPVWIKLYTKGIEDTKGDWYKWTDLQRGHIVGIWQLAAKMNNCIPYDNDFVFSEIAATDEVILESFGDHLEVFASRADCLASISASGSASKEARGCASNFASISSPSFLSDSEEDHEVVSPKKKRWAERLLKKHGLTIPEKMTAERADEIIDTLKDAKVTEGPKAHLLPQDPELELTPEERELAIKAYKEATGNG